MIANYKGTRNGFQLINNYTIDTKMFEFVSVPKDVKTFIDLIISQQFYLQIFYYISRMFLKIFQ